MSNLPNDPFPAISATPNPNVDLPPTDFPSLSRIIVTDLVGPLAANQQDRALEKRDEYLRSLIVLLAAAHDQYDNFFLRRNGLPQKDTNSGIQGTMPFNGHRGTNVGAPTAPNDIAIRQTVDDEVLARQAETSMLTVNLNTETAQRIAYDATKIDRGGDSMDSGADLNFSGSGQVRGLPAVPANSTAATSKAYVDGLFAGAGPFPSTQYLSYPDFSWVPVTIANLPGVQYGQGETLITEVDYALHTAIGGNRYYRRAHFAFLLDTNDSVDWSFGDQVRFEVSLIVGGYVIPTSNMPMSCNRRYGSSVLPGVATLHPAAPFVPAYYTYGPQSINTDPYAFLYPQDRDTVTQSATQSQQNQHAQMLVASPPLNTGLYIWDWGFSVLPSHIMDGMSGPGGPYWRIRIFNYSASGAGGHPHIYIHGNT